MLHSIKIITFLVITSPIIILAQKVSIDIVYHGNYDVHLYSISNYKGYTKSIYKGKLPYKGKIDFSKEEELFLIANGYKTKRVGSEDFLGGTYLYEIEKFETKVVSESCDWVYFNGGYNMEYIEKHLFEGLGNKLVTNNSKGKDKPRFKLLMEVDFAQGLSEKSKTFSTTKLTHFKSCRWIVIDVILDKEVYNKIHYGGYYIGDQTAVGGAGAQNAKDYIVMQNKIPFKYATNSLLSDEEFSQAIMKKNDLDVDYPEPIVINIDTSNFVSNLDEAKSAVVAIKLLEGIGAGFFISNDGYILTSFHLIKNVNDIDVLLTNGMLLEAKLVRYNITNNVALLKIDLSGMKTFSLENKNLGIGKEVYAIGVSEGNIASQTMSKGVISGKPLIEGVKYIQSDVSINKGNNGGPLITKEGELLGIITAKISGEGVEGLTFSIPLEQALKVLNCPVK